ncbi:polysaccharide deacetylase family protein [Niastella populi]|uniref:Polysaccharide deacetylase n=1 Tax=Niastella populi TaxID=550983 RepID=A0A1V9F097_9BACT|nr:polysaccharide deacetylase family protein [Niastella populi]OQP51696.1 polysaccharide deacetylase [Niastella populi]
MRRSLRNVLGYIAANTFILAGFVRQARKKALNTPCIIPLYFHKPEKQEFEFCVRWLKKKGFRFLSPYDIEKVKKGELPFPTGGVCITVDDGWQSNVKNVVEVANRYEVPVTIFVSTTPAEEGAYWWSYVHQAKQKGMLEFTKKELKKMPEEKRLGIIQELKKKVFPGRDAMTVEEVISIANSPFVTIGSHTQTHPILINCQDKQVYDELKTSRQKLEAWIGKEVPYFAYPNGDFSQREIQILNNLDYKLAFCSQPKYLTPELLKDHYMLPRFGFLEGASAAENICRITGVWQSMMLRIPHPGLKN